MHKIEGSVVEQVMQMATALNTRGTHVLSSSMLEIHGRSCMAYLPFGVFSIVDVQVIEVKKAYRSQGVFRGFLNGLIEQAGASQRDGIRFMNIINPKLEDFLIRIGFRLLNSQDYILMRDDFETARNKLSSETSPIL